MCLTEFNVLILTSAFLAPDEKWGWDIVCAASAMKIPEYYREWANFILPILFNVIFVVRNT
jgi:hypothetical protein